MPSLTDGSSHGEHRNYLACSSASSTAAEWPSTLTLAKYLADDSFAVDDEGRSLDAHKFLAVHVLFFPDAVGVADLVAYVGEQRERKLEFLGEFGMRIGVVGADAQDNGPFFLKSADSSRKLHASVVQPGVSSLG